MVSTERTAQPATLGGDCPTDRGSSLSCIVTVVEILLIFAVFALQGGWPVPDVNEAYYLGKAIHYWNPDWLRGDFFMESSDTHIVFYYAFGWLSLWLKPTALAWTGRIITWMLLAFSWQRLSVAIVPKRWASVLTAALFVCLMDRCHMAGEWVVGGVEAKGFAYALFFLGLESLVRNRWNRGLLLFGASSAIHVLVGGWGAIAAGLAWLWLTFYKKHDLATTDFDHKIKTPPLRSLWPGIVGGFLLSLPGLIPSLMIDCGADASIVRQAHWIYVFERLPHHLVLTGIRPEFILRLVLLWAFWLCLGRWSRRENLVGVRQLRAFVTGAVIITLVGAALHLLIFVDDTLAANLLRFYWFRLTDVVLPLGVALEGVAIVTCVGWKTVKIRRIGLALATLLAAFHLGDKAVDRVAMDVPRSHQMPDFAAWREACQWVADAKEIPADAQFLTPRLGQTFHWFSGHNGVVDWKDVPQDAASIVEWRDRIQTIYATGKPLPDRWYQPLTIRGETVLKQLGAKYHADYLITESTDPALKLPILYQNGAYIVYRLP